MTRVRDVWLHCLVACLALFTAAVLALPGQLMLLVLINAFAISLTYTRTGRSLLVPSLLFSVLLSTLGLVGFATTDSLAKSFRIPYYLATFGGKERNEALAGYQVASFAALLGAYITRGRQELRRVSPADLSSVTAALRKPAAALGFGAATLIFNLSVRPFGQILERDHYLIRTPFGGVLTYLQIPAAVLLGLALRPSRWPARVASVLLIFLLEAFSFALSSRVIALVALMYFVGVALGSRRARPLLLLAGLATAILLVPIPLYMRGQPTQGLLPNLHALPHVTIFSYDAYLNTFANFISSFNVVALTTSASKIPWNDFWLSVGPLPGSLFSGASTGGPLRVSSAVPYAGLGEVANHGIWLVFLVFFLVGSTFGTVESATSRLLHSKRFAYLTVAPTGVSFLAALLFAQYNLRTACRLVYVNLVLAIVMSAIAARSTSATSKMHPKLGLAPRNAGASFGAARSARPAVSRPLVQPRTAAEH